MIELADCYNDGCNGTKYTVKCFCGGISRTGNT